MRAGIPLVSASRKGRWTDDTVVAMALGALPLVTGLATPGLTSSELPGPPHTLLAQILPALAPMTGVIPGAIAIVLAVAIPALAVRGFSPRPEMRVLLAVVLMALIGAAALSTGTIIGGDSAPWQQAAWAIVSTAIALLALVVWGSVSVLSWFMAALFLGALSGINDVITAPTTVERFGAALAVTLALGLFAAGARYAQQRAEPAGSWQRTLLREGH
jgi:hypothetical protein